MSKCYYESSLDFLDHWEMIRNQQQSSDNIEEVWGGGKWSSEFSLHKLHLESEHRGGMWKSAEFTGFMGYFAACGLQVILWETLH